jgi:hypothetical protein
MNISEFTAKVYKVEVKDGKCSSPSVPLLRHNACLHPT